MSIFSKIGSAVKSAYNTVKSYVTGSGNVASASTAPVFGSAAYNSQSVKSGAQPATGVGSVSYGASGTWSPAASIGAGKLPSTGINSSGGTGSTSYGPQLPVTINAGQQRVSGGGGSTLSLSGFNPEAFSSYSQPTTISAKTLGAQSNLGTTGGTGSFSGAQPLALSSAPSGTKVNGIDNTKLAGGMSGYYKYNSATGSFDEVPQADSSLQNGQNTDQQIFDKYSKLRKDLGIETKQSVYEDPQVIEARNERQRIQQALQVPTSELNAIMAKQNQDLLQLRQTGSQEGVTEAVYGGQQNAINYNAAIRALPLQASIASLQGDLKLAQDYLSELTQIKQEQINNQYEANTQLFNAISGAIDKKNQRAYEELKSKNENATKEALDLEDFKAKLALTAMQNSAPSNVMTRIANATDKMSAIQASGSYAVDTVERENKRLQNEKLQAEIDNNKPVTGEFASVINGASGLVANVKKQQVKTNIASALTNGDYTTAYAEIANAVSDGLTGTPKTKFDDARTDAGILSGMRNAIQQYSDAGGNMGLLKGTEEQIKRKLGIDSGKASALATQLWREFQTYRSNMTGAAFTPQESRDYASVNPTLGKSLDLNLSVIDGALSQLETRIVSTVNARIPDAKKVYDLASGKSSTVSAGVTVNVNGQIYSFPDQKSADAFKKAANIQ